MVERKFDPSSTSQEKIHFPAQEMRSDAAIGAAVGLLASQIPGAPSGNVYFDLMLSAWGAITVAGFGALSERSYGEQDKDKVMQMEQAARDSLREQARDIIISGGFDTTGYNKHEKTFFNDVQTHLFNNDLCPHDISKGRRLLERRRRLKRKTLRRQGVLFDSPRRTLLKRGKRA